MELRHNLDPHGLTISLLPLSVPSLDEDRVQMSIGTISGVTQWTVNTSVYKKTLLF